MANNERRWKVALVGYYGFGNLGDELLLVSALKQLENLGVGNDKVVVLAANPGSYSKLGARVIDRWNVAEIWRTLRMSETLLLGGGGLFQSVTSLRSCLYYWGIVRMACLAGAVPWALGQSIGPFFGNAGKAISRNALSKCKVIEVRDEISKSVAEGLGLNVETGNDLAFTLKPDDTSRGSALLVNFRRWRDTGNFVSAVRDYAVARGGECIGVAMSPQDLSFMKELGINFSELVLPQNWEDACKIWMSGGEAIGMRLHFSLLSLMFGLKQAIFPYDPKVLSFASRWGVPLWDDKNLSAPTKASVDLRDVHEKTGANFKKYAARVMNLS